jgi:hypothetical protein
MNDDNVLILAPNVELVRASEAPTLLTDHACSFKRKAA